MRRLTLAVVHAVLATGVAAAQARPPIIDMHMHARMAPSKEPLPCEPQPCASIGSVPLGPRSVLQETIRAMDQYNVIKGFLSDDLEAVYKWVAAAPGRFIASPAWSHTPPAIALLRNEYAQGRLQAMGEIATQYAGLAPNDPQLEPYFALAEELDLPVLVHTAGFGAPLPLFRPSRGHPLLLEDVVIRHPRLRIYIENAGYPFGDEAIALMYRYPQVHADVSTITWLIPAAAFYAYLETLVRAGLGKRLMYGSDQMEWPEAIDVGIRRLEGAAYLTEQQKRDIFYDNAARFLKLPVVGGAGE
jgi:uncharacterized protein